LHYVEAALGLSFDVYRRSSCCIGDWMYHQSSIGHDSLEELLFDNSSSIHSGVSLGVALASWEQSTEAEGKRSI
jgi:hypothetical protein